MPGPTLPSRACCRKCGYELASIAGDVCPECGRAFDRADPRSYDPSPWARRTRRWGRIALIGTVVALVLAAAAPRGYVRSSITITCPTCGLDRTISATQLIASSWVPWTYPAWTSTTDRTPSTSTAGCSHGVTFNLAISKKRLTIRGVRGGGGLTASSGPTNGGTGLLNQMPVTGASAESVLRIITREVASSGGFGVSVTGAGGGSSARSGAAARPSRRRPAREGDHDLETQPLPP